MISTQFSENGKYFARISRDGKLKVWNAQSCVLEQEFTPDYHLTTPCTCLHFWESTGNHQKDSPSPKKKKRKPSTDGDTRILLGTTSGLILVYSIAKACVDFTIVSTSNVTSVNCLSVTSDGYSAFSGNDKNILEWDLRKKEVKGRWKAGDGVITAILALSNSRHLVTASKNIKLWDLTSKQILKTFTGHCNDIITLNYINHPDATDSYLLSGSKADRLLSCWNLSTVSKQKNAICQYLMEDAVENVTVKVRTDGATSIAATSRSGTCHVYQHKLNGKCDKPVKPKTSVQVVSAQPAGQTVNEPVKPIKIFAARFPDSDDTFDTLTVTHGTEQNLTFENVTLTSVKRLEVLVRLDPNVSKKNKDEQVTKVKKPVVGENVNYLTEGLTEAGKRKISGVQEEIPMEQRLENLTLTGKSDPGKVPRSDNVAQLLLQGLHSKDKSILRTALCRKDETVIRNTVKRLPVTVFEPLIQELSILVHGKTVLSRFGALWLKHLAQAHAGVLISNPNLADLFSAALGTIYSRINAQSALRRLRGKLELLVPQVTLTADVDDVDSDALLVFNDRDLSDEEESDEDQMQIEIPSDSEPEDWEENDAEMTSDSDSESVVIVNDDQTDSD